jgi:hypothetical protein
VVLSPSTSVCAGLRADARDDYVVGPVHGTIDLAPRVPVAAVKPGMAFERRRDEPLRRSSTS